MWERYPRAPETRITDRRRVVWSVFLAIFIVGGLFFGYLFYASVRDIVAYAELPFLIAGPPNAAHPDDPAQQGPITERRLTDRVNILFLGIDRRDNDPGPWRTDTMILFSVDPISKTVSMLSIPRDLWVPLPGYGEERINAAHVYGDQFQYPGGGPALAKRTVQYNLGVPVHYYVRLDFVGFKKIIDEIGGIDVDVPRDIIDNEYPTPDGGTMRLFIRAGRQHMDGDLALKYARTRHDSSDIDRAYRQQQVILAVRDRVLSAKIVLSLDRIPGLLRTLGESFKTDMTVEQMYAVYQAARDVQKKDINQGVIDDTMTIPWQTPQGWDVLVPQRDKIRDLVGQLFPSPTPQVSLGPLGDRDKLQQEAARVEVQNGTQVAGLATKMAAELRTAGYNVVRFGNADRADYPQTVIIYYTEKKYALASVKAYLKVADGLVAHQTPPAGTDVDIRIILGSNAVKQ